MSSTLLCIGLTHETAGIAARERFALSGPAARELTAELMTDPDILEVVPVGTCNRSELYLHVSNADKALALVYATFARLADVSASDIDAITIVRRDADAVQHLLSVASGLESVVLGEAEIQGQLKKSLTAAHDEKLCGAFLDRLFRQALSTGKDVRTATCIGKGHASVGTVAADLLYGCLGTLEGKHVLVMGAGEMGELVMTNMTSRGADNIIVANRNYDHAAMLAKRLGGKAVSYDNLTDNLVACDAVVAATAAPHAMLTRARMLDVMQQRDNAPLVVIDLAVPRDADPEIASLPGLQLHDLDDIERQVGVTRSERETAARAARDVIAASAGEFEAWRRSLDVVPAIRSLRTRGEVIRQREMDRVAPAFEHLAPEDRRRVEQLTRSIVNKLLHQPTVRLRERAVTADDERAVAYAGTVRDLFALDEDV